jgi:DNA-binding CsgD family transcriptional regulator
MEWIRVAEAFHADRGSPHLYTTCRVEYGAVLFASGEWERAEEELERARGVSRLAEPVLYAQATGRLVELRLAQGRLDDAHRLLVGLEDEPAVAGTIAMLALARGEARASAAVASRRLHDIDDATLEAAALHEIVAEADVASGLVADALATGEHLTAQGAGIGNQLIIARGHRTCGRALLSIGDPGATGHLERAISIFGRLGLPYDASVSRLLLARATVGTDPEVAIAEARTAHGVFVGLGATREGDAAAALLRSLGVRTSRGGPRALGTLTHREREVLALLGEGLSNPEIGDRLFITRKTVEHHVASVLAKLGLSGRAEAAAYAVRHGTDGPAENG